MHELSLAAEIVRMVEESAQAERFQRVARLRLEVGALAGVEVSALRFALEACAASTCLEGAAVEIDEPPGRAWCAHCAEEVEILSRAEPCPQCGGYPVKSTSGFSLRVLELVVQDD
jgi:hydrogenase nickel incorporation protein HypA/HybF